MSSGRGQGGAQGGREFSLTASLVTNAAPTCTDASQGGREAMVHRAPKSPQKPIRGLVVTLPPPPS